MKQIKIIPFLFLLFLITAKISAQENVPYISPGITLGWNSNGSISISPKISLGMMWQGGYYTNITFGIMDTFSERVYNYEYLEFQLGSVRHFISGGTGVAFTHKDNKTEIVPKFSLSAGLMLFANLDLVVHSDSVNSNLGIQGVLPLMLIKHIEVN